MSFLSFVALPNGLAAGDSVLAQWSVSLPAPGTFSLYLQVDSGFWWLNDPAYGRVLEYSERDNAVWVGRISTSRQVYLPVVMR